ncbi:hypothetical protein J7E96_35310 [Streptomyces sp. ISL-96]|nr:hypothetical protein [Streptomyces sp. ISL-96]
MVRRPTEGAAVHAASRSPRPLPPTPSLFASLVTAYAVGDRHGVNLIAHAIARNGGEVGER